MPNYKFKLMLKSTLRSSKYFSAYIFNSNALFALFFIEINVEYKEKYSSKYNFKVLVLYYPERVCLIFFFSYFYENQSKLII